MAGLKKFIPLFLLVLMGLVLLGSALPLVARAALPQASQWGGGKWPVLASSNAGKALNSVYLPIVQRSMCGKITTDTSWTVIDSPIQVTCDLIVSSGVTLTIDAGVLVQFAHPDDDLIISGTLQVAGAEDAPIHFQPLMDTTPGSWGRIAFMPGSSGKLDHTILEYGGSSEGMVYIASNAVQVMNSVMQYSANTGIYIHAASPLISGTQIISNTASVSGGGLYNDTGSPIIQNNTFRNNTVSNNYGSCYGGGLYNYDGNPTIQNNLIANNSCSGYGGYGGGVYNETGSPAIQNNTIADNVVTGNYAAQYPTVGLGGGIFSFGSPIIQNNIFTGNKAEYWDSAGGGLYISSQNSIIQNNTFIGNSAGSGGGLHMGGDNLVFRNNIVVNNLGTGGILHDYGAPTLDYNDVWNNPGGNYYGIDPGAHDISADPLWVDPASGNYHLTTSSPCIDAGDPDHHPETDFEGDPRPMGAAPDIGADEFRTLSVKEISTPEEASPGGTITYAVNLTNMDAISLTNVLLTDTIPIETAFMGYFADGFTCTHDGSAWGGQLSCALDSVSLTPGESRVLTLTVKITDTLPAYIFVVNVVTATASGGGETFIASDRAQTWVSICVVQLNDEPMGRDLQTAIDGSMQTTDVIKVSGYCHVHNLSLNKTLTLQGGWSWDFSLRDPGVYTTTLDGRGLGRVLKVEGDVNPTIEGFVITGGKDNLGGGIYILSGNPIIQNNTFTDNTASGGGGLFNNGNPIIQNNVFLGNSAGFGGGLENSYGSPTIQDNIFFDNSVTDTGGGLETYGGSPIIQNNTLIGNSAGGGGGMYIISEHPIIIRSNIIGFNTANTGGGINNYLETPTLDYNDVWNNSGGDYYGVTPGEHDISADPLLVDPANGDFHLAPGSPCIDAGDPVHYPATDFEGDPRPIGAAPDIGADEFMGPLAFSWRLIAWRASSRSIRLPQMLIPLVQVFWSARGRRANS